VSPLHRVSVALRTAFGAENRGVRAACRPRRHSAAVALETLQGRTLLTASVRGAMNPAVIKALATEAYLTLYTFPVSLQWVQNLSTDSVPIQNSGSARTAAPPERPPTFNRRRGGPAR